MKTVMHLDTAIHKHFNKFTILFSRESGKIRKSLSYNVHRKEFKIKRNGVVLSIETEENRALELYNNITSK